jgi:hypothetical protein
MDGHSDVSLDGTLLIDGITNDIKDTTKGGRASRDHDGRTSVIDALTTDKALSGLHGNGTDGVLTQVLGNLKDKALRGTINLESVEDGG